MYLVYLLILLAFPFVVPLIIRRFRRGKIISEGTIRISKDLKRNAFISTVSINGREVEGLFDTGASETTIGIDLARSLGFEPDDLHFDGDADTAAGTIYGAIVGVTADEFQVGPIKLGKFGIGINRLGGRKCLVGMNFFDVLDSFEIRENYLTLTKTSNDRSSTADDTSDDAQFGSEVSAAHVRVPADCPSCNASMTLPENKQGKVKCHICKHLFFGAYTNGLTAHSRSVIS